VPPTLARTLRATNAVESMISICRNHTRNVKHWRDGQMAPRWGAAGMVEARGQFRRVNSHLHLPAPIHTYAQGATKWCSGAGRLLLAYEESLPHGASSGVH
jgi:hypothetical protein